MSQRKLVQAFRTFFQKSVAPFVSGNDDVMREWNHLNKIISSDPIDYSQIEFYLLLSNKNSTSNSSQPGSKGNIGSSNKIADDPNRFRYSDFNTIMDKNNFEKKGSFLSNNSNKKKNLIANLESFQKLLLFNQDRLQNLNKKEGMVSSGGVNTSANGISMRRY